MIIKTYLKSNAEFSELTDDFNPESFFVKIPRSDELEGGLEIQVDGEEVIGKYNWDYVHEIWGYFLWSLQDLVKKGKSNFYYPSVFIEVSLTKEDEDLLRMDLYGSDSHHGPYYCFYVDFIMAAYAGGSQFHQCCMRLYDPWDAKESFESAINFLKGEIDKFEVKFN